LAGVRVHHRVGPGLRAWEMHICAADAANTPHPNHASRSRAYAWFDAPRQGEVNYWS